RISARNGSRRRRRRRVRGEPRLDPGHGEARHDLRGPNALPRPRPRPLLDRQAAVKVWVDLTNPAHVVVLRPLVELLEASGHEVTLTARPLSHTTELLDDWRHPYAAIGQHRGAGQLGNALAAGSAGVQGLCLPPS